MHMSKLNMKRYLIGLYGFPGSGKTFFSEKLCQKTGWFHLSSDRVRLKMFRKPTYSKEEHEEVFNFMDWLAEELLSKNVSVVYDANFNFEESRKKLSLMAINANAEYRLVTVKTAEDVALARLENRHSISLLSKQDIYRPISKEVFCELKNEMQKPLPDEPVLSIAGELSFEEQFKLFEEGLQ